MVIHRRSAFAAVGLVLVSVVVLHFNRDLYWGLSDLLSSQNTKRNLVAVAAMWGGFGLALLAITHLQNRGMKLLWVMLFSACFAAVAAYNQVTASSFGLLGAKAFWHGVGFYQPIDFFSALFRPGPVLWSLTFFVGALMFSPRRLVPDAWHRWVPPVRDLWLHVIILTEIVGCFAVTLLAGAQAYGFVPTPVKVFVSLPISILDAVGG